MRNVLRRLAIAAALALVVAGVAPTAALGDTDAVAGGPPSLENAAGTARLGDDRADDRAGWRGRSMPLPGHGSVCRLISGIGLLWVLTIRRYRWRKRRDGSSGGPCREQGLDAATGRLFPSSASSALVPALVLLATQASAKTPQNATYAECVVGHRGEPLDDSVDLELSFRNVEERALVPRARESSVSFRAGAPTETPGGRPLHVPGGTGRRASPPGSCAHAEAGREGCGSPCSGWILARSVKRSPAR